MANGNGNKLLTIALSSLVTLLVCVGAAAVSYGRLQAEVESNHQAIGELKALVQQAVDNRYRDSDAMRDWNQHMRDEHGKGGR